MAANLKVVELEDDSEDSQKMGELVSQLKPIDIAPFLTSLKDANLSKDVGKIPAVQWLPIAALRINHSYQREVKKNGKSNVIEIAKNFNWSKFGIVVVAAMGDQTFAIIDGQHRTIGAACRGIDTVPCLILYNISVEQQAEIFAAINGKVTAISPLSIFHAELRAKYPDAISLYELCKSVGVTICTYAKPHNAMVWGETVSIISLKAMRNMYGDKVLEQALKCIMKAPGRHSDIINVHTIRAMCHVLDAEETFRVPEYRLVSLMEKFDLYTEWQQSYVDAKMKRKRVAGALAVRIFNYLDKEIE